MDSLETAAGFATLCNGALESTGSAVRAEEQVDQPRVITPPSLCWFRADFGSRNRGKPQVLAPIE
ncbi:hypothetical protein SSP24_28750 [Streptomyces spinoverrucosus]|uniref:Uncharacterized protein n=1 Tax=Streptomyces spinoverrucosus TaxID=284043 RepID=A0A4Y3VHD9_9ACTN|nr:hypothetical protein SSP24_28750 [Streptomyces spinoverrucosus]GHB72710.1 hypothetical protein GCM10010397_48920 [Streptomyces spinoverrucosus]